MSGLLLVLHLVWRPPTPKQDVSGGLADPMVVGSQAGAPSLRVDQPGGPTAATRGATGEPRALPAGTETFVEVSEHSQQGPEWPAFEPRAVGSVSTPQERPPEVMVPTRSAGQTAVEVPMGSPVALGGGMRDQSRQGGAGASLSFDEEAARGMRGAERLGQPWEDQVGLLQRGYQTAQEQLAAREQQIVALEQRIGELGQQQLKEPAQRIQGPEVSLTEPLEAQQAAEPRVSADELLADLERTRNQLSGDTQTLREQLDRLEAELRVQRGIEGRIIQQERMVRELTEKLKSSYETMEHLTLQLDESQRGLKTLQSQTNATERSKALLEEERYKLLQELDELHEQHAWEIDSLNRQLQRYKASAWRQREAPESARGSEARRPPVTIDQRQLQQRLAEARAQAEDLRKTLQAREQRVRESKDTLAKQKRELQEAEAAIRALRSLR